MNSPALTFPVSGNVWTLEFPTFRKWLWSVHDHIIPHERNNYHPHVLSHRMMALLSILVLAIKIASVSVIAFSPATPSEAAEITIENVVSLTNSARVENGLGELRVSSLLSRAAQAKASDMLAKQYFSHNTPEGDTPWTFIKAVGYSYTTAGENLAIDFSQAENIQSAWMNSPGHRANILNGNFTEIGIGITSGTFDNHQTTIVVQMFGNPLNAPVTLKEEPTKIIQAPAAPEVVAPMPVQAPVVQKEVAPLPVAPVAVRDSVRDSDVAPISLVNESAPLEIYDTKTSIQDNDLYVEVTASSNVAKMLALYGESSVMLDPIGEGLWKGVIRLNSIKASDSLSIQAQDINGQMHQEPVAQFSTSLNPSYLGDVQGAQVTLFGTTFNLKFWEEKIYLILLAVIIISLIIAIAIKRHVQHVSLVANTSFVAMLIAMMLTV